MGGFEGAIPPPRTWPPKVPGEVIRQLNLLAAGALPRTPLGELTALPQTP